MTTSKTTYELVCDHIATTTESPNADNKVWCPWCLTMVRVRRVR